MEGNRIWREIKINRFKLNNLIIYIYSNLFYLFLSIIVKDMIFILNLNLKSLSF